MTVKNAIRSQYTPCAVSSFHFGQVRRWTITCMRHCHAAQLEVDSRSAQFMEIPCQAISSDFSIRLGLLAFAFLIDIHFPSSLHGICGWMHTFYVAAIVSSQHTHISTSLWHTTWTFTSKNKIPPQIEHLRVSISPDTTLPCLLHDPGQSVLAFHSDCNGYQTVWLPFPALDEAHTSVSENQLIKVSGQAKKLLPLVQSGFCICVFWRKTADCAD